MAPLGKLELRDVKNDDDDLSWSIEAKMPLPITAKFTAIVDGDSITGAITSKLVSGDFKGSRVTVRMTALRWCKEENYPRDDEYRHH